MYGRNTNVFQIKSFDFDFSHFCFLSSHYSLKNIDQTPKFVQTIGGFSKKNVLTTKKLIRNKRDKKAEFNCLTCIRVKTLLSLLELVRTKVECVCECKIRFV